MAVKFKLQLTKEVRGIERVNGLLKTDISLFMRMRIMLHSDLVVKMCMYVCLC